MHITATPKGVLRRWAAVTLSAAIASTTLLASGVLTTSTAQAAPVSYPWSKITGTGNYINDKYHVGADNVFENVTTDRLLDILSSNGSYYIFFGGPEHAASQALLPTINDAAKAKGITTIYHFDPYVDGYQLDSTLKSGVADVTGGTSVNFSTWTNGKVTTSAVAKLSDVWKLITNLLPASTIASGGVLENYAGNTALLLNVKVTDRTNVDTGKTVTKLAEVKDADAAAFVADTSGVKTAAATALASAFDGKTSDVRTQWQFFKRLYNASATKTEGTTPSAFRIGAPVEIFSDSDFPNPASDFRLKSIDLKELYDLLNSPGEVPILFAGQGCHNTQAIIGSVAKEAKALNVPVVYVVDLALDSNVKFGTGASIDTALGNSATGGLWVRSGNAALATTAPYQYGYSYLYGKLAEYFGPNWITENSSKKNNSVAYYPNAVLGEASTTNPYAATFNPATDKANATRLQVPTLVRYNKDAANPIVGEWLHADKVAANAAQTYTEYMLELAWVRQTALAVADTSRTAGLDGLTKVEFAAEAVESLDNVLKANTTVTHKFTTTPTPTIGGVVAVGSKLDGYWEAWSQNPSLSYQWYADGVAISGATSDSYTLTPAEVGKKITFATTGSRVNYTSVTKTSLPTAAVAQGAFVTASAPVVSGDAVIGSTLTATPGVWSPTATFTYQWLADGKAISGATAATYKVTVANLGKKLSVQVVGTAPGRVATTRTSAQTAAVVATLTKTPTPKITGKAKVGKKLKASTAAWKPAAKLTYQWNANGTPIPGATKATFTVALAQVGAKLTVTVTGSRSGFATVAKTSAATKAVPAATFTKGTPVIKGKPVVGQVLSASPGSWKPKAGVTFAYQWLANGTVLAGATSAKLTLGAEVVGKKISVKVTATKLGYATASTVSKTTAKVK